MKQQELKVILVDDEPHAVQLIKKILQLFPNNVKVVGEAHDLPAAIKLITEKEPHAVFMDIDMPNYSGLQINDFFNEQRNFKLVYITAHDAHILTALRLQAFDYILKPVDSETLSNCIERLNKSYDSIEEKNEVKSITESSKKIAINSHHGVSFIDLNEVIYIEASGMYSVIHTATNQTVVSKPLKEFDYLSKQGFYRVHRSFIVATNRVKKLTKIDGDEIELENGQRVPIARNRKVEFLKFMRS